MCLNPSSAEILTHLFNILGFVSCSCLYVLYQFSLFFTYRYLILAIFYIVVRDFTVLNVIVKGIHLSLAIEVNSSRFQL